MAFQVQGELKAKYDTQVVSERFKKRELIVTIMDNPQYPQYIKFELKQDRCSLLDDYNVGDQLEVHFNLSGREWTNPQGELKYFTTLEAWRLVAVGANQTNAGNVPQPQQPQENMVPLTTTQVIDQAQDKAADDLPF